MEVTWHRPWSEEEKALLILSCTEKLGPATARGLIEHFGSATAVLNASPHALQTAPGMGSTLLRTLKSGNATKVAEEEYLLLKELAEKGHNITPIFTGSEQYPDYLDHCFDAPLILYVKGSLPVDGPMVAIVGTRRCTPYAEDALRYLIKGWAQLCPKMIIVSGLAYGVDYLAHSIAIEYGLRSIAVVAHGHHTIYPNTHKGIASEMIKRGGGVVTEYSYKTKALPQRFIARNRIVAGLSLATIVVESPMKGGALITGNIAFDYGRQLYAIPGRVFDKTSEGCNRMIAQQKASIITTPEALLEDLYLMPEYAIQAPLPYIDETSIESKSDDHPIIAELRYVDTLTAEDLALRLGCDLPTIANQLFELELEELIRALPGGRYAIKNK